MILSTLYLVAFMEAENKALARRLRKVEAAKSHTRKIAYTFFAVTITSFVVLITRTQL